MWSIISVATPTEPVTIAEARRQCNMLADECEFDLQLMRLIGAARQHVEKVCGLYFGARAAVLSCDGFSDFCRLPVAPVSSVTSIAYVDTAGSDQTIPNMSYELRGDDELGAEPAIMPVYGTRWPQIRQGSRILVTLNAGFTVAPAPVVHAMLLWIGDAFASRETAAAGAWTNLDSLLCNHRRGV